jgi:putative transcriptional regulator
VEIEFDSAKDAANRLKHGVPLALGAAVLMNLIGRIEDDRHDYGETRFNAFGLVNQRLHVCVYTMRRRLSGDFGPQGQQAGAMTMAIVKVTPAMVDRAIRETDWAAQDALTDAQIARQVADNPEAAPILSDAATAAAIVRTVRKRLGISQAEFAARYHIPVGTLRDWEQDRKRPDAPALAYLRVIAREPEVTARALESVG